MVMIGLQILTYKVLKKPKMNSLQELKSLNIGRVHGGEKLEKPKDSY